MSELFSLVARFVNSMTNNNKERRKEIVKDMIDLCYVYYNYELFRFLCVYKCI